jgi:hypothetical protein
MSTIYISYQYSDSEFAQKLSSRLVEAGLAEPVITGGLAAKPDLNPSARERQSAFDVMIVVVGPNWSKELNIDTDCARLELALQNNTLIIPVLVADAPMPRPGELPESICQFAYREAVPMGDDFERATERIISLIVGRRGCGPGVDVTPTPFKRSKTTGKRMRDPTEAALSSIQDALSVRHTVNDPEHAPAPPPWRTLRASEPILKSYCSPTGRGEDKLPSPAIGMGNAAPQDAIELGVSYPSSLKPASAFLFEAWLFQRKDRENARDRANEHIPSANFFSGGATSITRGTAVTIRLKIESWEIEPMSQRIIWDGTLTNVSFAVRTPNVHRPALDRDRARLHEAVRSRNRLVGVSWVSVLME